MKYQKRIILPNSNGIAHVDMSTGSQWHTSTVWHFSFHSDSFDTYLRYVNILSAKVQ